MPTDVPDGLARVKPNEGGPGNQRIIKKAAVTQGILDDKRILVEDGVAAKRNIARRFQRVQTLSLHEPLAVGIDLAHQRNINPEKTLGQAHKTVKTLFRSAVKESSPPQGVQATDFICRSIGRAHGLFIHTESVNLPSTNTRESGPLIVQRVFLGSRSGIDRSLIGSPPSYSSGYGSAGASASGRAGTGPPTAIRQLSPGLR